jgi:hypothetical protein
MAYQNHILSILASVLCCAGILWLVITPVQKAPRIYESATFLPTYGVGILSWTIHGLQIGSYALAIPCAIQLVALVILLRRALALRSSGKP